KAERIGEQLATLRREPEGLRQLEPDIAKGKPTDESRHLDKPKAGGGFAARYDAETLRGRREHQARDNHYRANGQNRDQIPRHDLSQQRRPIERKERADATESERDRSANGHGEACYYR